MSGYHFFRMHRTVGRGGGFGSSEGIFIEIQSVGGSKILVGIIYLPHGNVSTSETLIADFVSQYEHFL